MSIFESAGLKLLRLSNPEFAHNVAIKALNLGLVPKPKTSVFENLKTSICGLELDSPVGLAAGFDKNAEALYDTYEKLPDLNISIPRGLNL